VEIASSIDISLRVKEVRKALNLKRDKFADVLSMSTSHLANIENGRRSITIDNLCALRKLYGVSANYILFGIGDMFIGEEKDKTDIYALSDSEKIVKMFQLYEYFTRYKRISFNNDDIEVFDFIQKVDERMHLVFYKQYKDKIKISDKW